MESFEQRLLAAVREREPGESALAAFGGFLRETTPAIAQPAATDALKTIARVISDSPALLAREQRIFAQFTLSLAAVLAEETNAKNDDVRPWVAANALVGVHRAQIEYVRRRSLAGQTSTLQRDLLAQTRSALATLERGLRDYAVRPAGKRSTRRL